MEFALPLYAMQRLADGTWLVRTLMGDPMWPAVDVVVVLGAPTSAALPPARAARPWPPQTHGQTGGWAPKNEQKPNDYNAARQLAGQPS
jgi:hypothetical protein